MTLFVARDCSLCERARGVLDRVGATYEAIDITGDERLRRLAQDLGPGAVAAEPAVVATVGGDDRRVALLRRAVGLAAHDDGEHERFAPSRQLGRTL